MVPRDLKPKAFFRQNKRQSLPDNLQENMSDKADGIMNPAFNGDSASERGTSKGNQPIKHEPFKTVVNTADRKVMTSEMQRSGREDGQERSVPTAQVAPTMNSPVTGNVTNGDIDLDKVAIDMGNEDTNSTDHKRSDSQDVALNMEIQRMKASLRKKSSLAESFDKVKVPVPLELDVK